MEPLTIAVMGATGSGKTTFINTISGSSLETSAGLKSCTDRVQETPKFEVDGRSIVLIDTPGFDDTTKSDREILDLIAQFLASSYRNGRKLSGLIFMHRICDFRMGGISTKNFRMFRRLCGEDTLKNVIIVTNMWGLVDYNVGEAREVELASQDIFFKPALDKGARMMRHLNTVDSAKDIVKRLFDNHAAVLQIQREVVDEKKEIMQTSAGDEIDKEMREMMEKQALERERIRREAEEALRLREEEARKQQELEAQRVREEIARIEAERQRQEQENERQRQEMEHRRQQEEEARQREAERIRREFEAHVAEIRRREEEEARRHREETERMQRELEQQRRRHRHHGGGGGCCIQ